jgi:hypothetical protein
MMGMHTLQKDPQEHINVCVHTHAHTQKKKHCVVFYKRTA